MAFQAVPNTIKVWMNYVLGSRNMGNAIYVNVGDVPDLATVTQVVNAVDTWQSTWLNLLLTQDINLTYIQGTSLASATAPQYTKAISPIRPGAVASTSNPGGVAAVITWKTALRGRSYRGRTYIAGIPESAVANALFDATFVNGLTVAANQLEIAISAIFYDLVVVSRYALGVLRPTGITTPITTWSVNNRPDSQRRRNNI